MCRPGCNHGTPKNLHPSRTIYGLPAWLTQCVLLDLHNSLWLFRTMIVGAILFLEAPKNPGIQSSNQVGHLPMLDLSYRSMRSFPHLSPRHHHSNLSLHTPHHRYRHMQSDSNLGMEWIVAGSCRRRILQASEANVSHHAKQVTPPYLSLRDLLSNTTTISSIVVRIHLRCCSIKFISLQNGTRSPSNEKDGGFAPVEMNACLANDRPL
jgi:hypothetical protein